MAALTANLEFANWQVRVEIARIVNHKRAPHVAVHTRAHHWTSKPVGVLLVAGRKSPSLWMHILAAGVVRERSFKKIIPSTNDVSHACHRRSESIGNLLGVFRELGVIRARLELTHVVLAILPKHFEAMGAVLPTNGNSLGRQITKLRTLAGQRGCLPMRRPHEILIDFQVARSALLGPNKSNSAGEISKNNVAFASRFGCRRLLSRGNRIRFFLRRTRSDFFACCGDRVSLAST